MTWIRRGRIDADRGLAGNIPLGEELQAYSIEVVPNGGPAVRRVIVPQQ